MCAAAAINIPLGKRFCHWFVCIESENKSCIIGSRAYHTEPHNQSFLNIFRRLHTSGYMSHNRNGNVYSIMYRRRRWLAPPHHHRRHGMFLYMCVRCMPRVSVRQQENPVAQSENDAQRSMRSIIIIIITAQKHTRERSNGIGGAGVCVCVINIITN